MSVPVSLLWNQGANFLHGFDSSNSWIDQPLTFPVLVPGINTTFTDITVQSSALLNRSYDVIKNLVFYLVPSDISQVSLLTGLVKISFDRGATFQDLTTSPLVMDGLCVGSTGVDGVLGPYDLGRIQIKIQIPESFTSCQALSFSIGADFDLD